MEAIRVLKECEFDNRFATPEEQEILSQYVGWGGIPEAFDENNSSWADEFIELYTAQDSKIYGVEIDKISAGIAQQLYQKTSIAAQPFEEANIPDSFFDAVIGNVPFGDIRINERRYNKHNFLIHDYFFAKSLAKIRPGGVMALITSKGTMDKENPAVRKYIAQRADLLGAIRLPNNTFKGNAGTEVVSDILILQKRDRLIDIELEWVHLNRYSLQHEKNYRRGEEHGSAKWGNAGKINQKYRDRKPANNKLLTQNVRVGLDGKKHKRNLKMIVCGGSGAGKTRFFCKPNAMQCNTSYVILDPKGENLRDTGRLLE